MTAALEYGRTAGSMPDRSVLHRVGPPPVSNGISFRVLPVASFIEIERVCDHYLAKASGEYSGPASRCVLPRIHPHPLRT